MGRPNARYARPTIHDVAREAGVAPSTVSRALSGEPRVASATRERVLRIATRLDYHPSPSAQALRSSRTYTLGLIFPSLENPNAIDEIRVTIKEAHELGYTVVISDTQDSAEIQSAGIARMINQRVDGVILGSGLFRLTPEIFDMLESSMPVEGNFGLTRTDVPESTTRETPHRDRAERDMHATVIAGRYLLQHGHRRIVMITRDGPSRLGNVRFEALREALRDNGDGQASLIRLAISAPARCVPEIQRLAAMANRPTAIVISPGIYTPYVLEGIQSADLRIPQDISVVTFGDSQWYRGYTPSLSTIRHDYADSARRAVHRIVARIEGKSIPDIPSNSSEFVARASIGPAPK